MTCVSASKVETPPLQVPRLQQKTFEVSEGSLARHYSIEKPLGSGSFGKVFRAKRLRTGECCVVKSIPIGKVSNSSPELQILPKIRHPNIVLVHEAFRDGDCLHLVMEYCEGGSLGKRIERYWREDDAALHLLHSRRSIDEPEGLPPWLVGRYLAQLISAVCFLHSNRLVHRDIKAENVMLSKANDHSPLRLIDFGCCCSFTPGVSLTHRVGTLHYVAPEVLRHCYTEKCDVWSVGVLAFLTSVGHKPFVGLTEEETTQKVLEAEPNFRPSDWHGSPVALRELVRAMLRKDPDERPSAEELLEQSAWLQHDTAKCTCSVM